MSTLEIILYTLKKAMKNKGVSQADAAELFSCDRSSVCAKLNGRRKFCLDELIKLCDLLGLEITLKERDS